jgi:alpha-N-arabinofuranosidase
VRPEAPRYETERFGEVDLLHATAVRDEETGAVTIFAVNRDQERPLPLEVAVRGLGLREGRVVEHSVLADADPDARNTRDEPERVVPHPGTGTELSDGTLRATLEPLSWNVIRLA